MQSKLSYGISRISQFKFLIYDVLISLGCEPQKCMMDPLTILQSAHGLLLSPEIWLSARFVYTDSVSLFLNLAEL
jgi:hypothetical protein